MATVFICLVLVTFIANAVISKSTTRWWRDPGSLFRAETEPEPVPVSGTPRVRQPWEITPRQEAEPRREAAAQSAARTGRHAMRSEPVMSSEPARSELHSHRAVPIEHAETEIIARIPGGGSRF